jgi:uncharacterized protein YndB with AHSA1/START domain
MLLDLSVTIDRPIEDVFAFIRDVDQQRHGDHVESIDRVTPGPAGVGTQYREIVRMPFGRRGEFLFEITEMEPPHRLTTRFRGPVMHGEIAYTLTPSDTGTRLDQSEELVYTGWAWPANILGRRALHAKVRRRLDGYKAQLEG